jgi:hypothetical protein
LAGLARYPKLFVELRTEKSSLKFYEPLIIITD